MKTCSGLIDVIDTVQCLDEECVNHTPAVFYLLFLKNRVDSRTMKKTMAEETVIEQIKIQFRN